MSKDPDHVARADQHNARGIELADRGWLDEAIKEFEKAIELDPASGHAHDNLATVYVEQQRFREALTEYLAALRLEPEGAAAHYNLASFLAGHGADMAVAEYREALALEPGYPDAQLNLGLTLADQGKTAEARLALGAAAAQDPRDALARHELAALHLDEGDHRAAIGLLKEVVRLEPANFEAHLDLGICYAQQGFYAEAERAYARAQELSPDDVLVNYNLAALLALWGRAADALAALRRALAVEPAKVRGWLEADPMFASLKGDAEYQALARG